MKTGERNKGHTQDFQETILIPGSLVCRLNESLQRLLSIVDLEKSDKVQRDDVKNIYKLLEYFSSKI